MSVILGIDPGLTGGLAFYDALRPALIAVYDMPVADKDVDSGYLFQLIRDHGPVAAFVEQVAARPGQGVSSMFRFGVVYGQALGVLGAAMVPVFPAPPATWKRKMGFTGGPAGKEQARAWAIRTFPACADAFRRKGDHGRADAAALAVYGAGKVAGTPRPKPEPIPEGPPVVIDWDAV